MNCTQYKTKEECDTVAECKYTNGAKRQYCRKRRNTQKKAKVCESKNCESKTAKVKLRK